MATDDPPKKLDVDAMIAELERLHPIPEGWQRPPDYPDTTDRHAMVEYIRARIMERRERSERFAAVLRERGITDPTPEQAAEIYRELDGRARARMPKGTTDSTLLIREDRDSHAMAEPDDEWTR